MTSTITPVLEERGTYTAIAVSFGEAQNAYAALTQLSELDAQDRVGIQEATVVVRDAEGHIIEKDRAGSPQLAGTAGGGLIGLLLGVIGGPLGMLIGGTSGLLVGSLIDVDDMEHVDSALGAIAGAVKPGSTSLIAVVSERSPEVIDTTMAVLGGTVVRRTVADIEAELAAAEATANQARRQARQALMQARREQSKAAVDAKLGQLKAKLHRPEHQER